MKSRYVIDPFTGEGIDEAIAALEALPNWLDARLKILVERCAEIGVTVASESFGQAQYDGTNDVSVTVDDRGDYAKAVVATGGAVLFIEFGTGVTYADNHPEKPDGIAARGTYGKGHGKQKTWGYYGEPGTNGIVKGKKDGSTIVLTHGNPASMSMYEARKQTEESIERICREVFNFD